MDNYRESILGFLSPKQAKYAELHKLSNSELRVVATMNTLSGRYRDAPVDQWESINVEVAPLLYKQFAPLARGPMPAETPGDLMTVSDAAFRLRVHRRTIDKALARGEVRRYGWRGSTRVSLREILKLAGGE
jgi:hypothetical protein